MTFFDQARSDLRTLLQLTRESATYRAHISVQPSLITDESQAKSVARELRIAELEARYGLQGH